MSKASGKNGGKNGRKRGRRKFLKTIALGTGALALPGGARSEAHVDATPASAKSAKAGGNGERRASQAGIDYPRVFRGAHRQMVAFPLGGVGAGSVSLGGRGQLHEWWIFNRPDKGNSPEYAFPSIWVEAQGRKPVARVLEARFMPPYEGPSGLGSANVPGLPRLASSTFTGEFPLATVEFEDAGLPVQVSLEAFTPFMPLDAEDSGLPVAVLRYRVSNPTAAKATVSIAWSVENPVGEAGRANEYRKSAHLEGLLMRNPFLAPADPFAGTLALALVEPGADGAVSYLKGWPSRQWWEGPLLFWDDFSSDGRLNSQVPAATPTGSLCLQREIPGHAERTYTFLLAWHFPNRTPRRCGWTAPKGHENDLIGNYYCTRFPDAWSVAQYAAERLPDLEARTRAFAAAMRESTLPGAVKDAATANLAALVSPTSFRTADGGFHGFEGCNDQSGCCFGSCTHVWNYEPAVAHLFPSLSRSLRERQFGFLTDPDGRMDFRELLPGGIERWGFAAADGQMGVIIKLYLDWRLSGDLEWLRAQWPGAKRALEFAWITGGWDANRDGVMEGVQHNTYDVEFVGPNPLCGVWYLGALRAGEEMARATGDSAAADEYRRLFRQGSEWIDAHLFNGEFYVQKTGSISADQVAPGLRVGMGAADLEHPTFQLGDGCLVDQLVGQYAARIAGLGLLLDRDHIRACLKSIYKYNYKRSLEDHETVQRTFALNDEAGLVICDYSRGRRPETPFPYFGEVMTGFEYSTAALMLYEGMVAEGLELVENIRRRYDGERRNPWDEAECGYYYARPMASWSAVLALSGFRYDGVAGSVTARPQIHPEKFSCFWSAPRAWGTFSQSISGPNAAFALSVAEGELACGSVALGIRGMAGKSSVRVGDRTVEHELRTSGEESTFVFPTILKLKKGERLQISMSMAR
ncbi:MAG TPA: GH116 family glycosyl-hydrolase [Terriglobia bacterium]|jgi:uncharacterized protein (DUF608 family)|nr:GH116 family glycosyl-hydrolase [Terriglobia bacterium]